MVGKGDALNALVEEIHQLIEVWAELRGQEDRQRLLPPASDAAISRLQAELGVTLPEDFQELLRLHNGWENFRGDYSLLSANEMLGEGPIKKVLTRLKEMMAEKKTTAEQDGIIFLASRFGWSCTYFDRSTHNRSGNMDVVQWEPAGEIKRHPSLLAYLEWYKEILEVLIAKERKKLRK